MVAQSLSSIFPSSASLTHRLWEAVDPQYASRKIIDEGLYFRAGPVVSAHSGDVQKIHRAVETCEAHLQMSDAAHRYTENGYQRRLSYDFAISIPGIHKPLACTVATQDGARNLKDYAVISTRIFFRDGGDFLDRTERAALGFRDLYTKPVDIAQKNLFYAFVDDIKDACCFTSAPTLVPTVINVR